MTSSRTAVVVPQGDTDILITREFDAPKHLVFRAWTTPDLIRRWWPGERGTMTECEVDLRLGGRWRYVMRANAGFEVAFHGEYHEVVPDERLVSTEVFEAMPAAAALNTATFVEHDGRTTLSLLVRHARSEHRDVHLNSGMEVGLNEGLARLDEILASLH